MVAKPRAAEVEGWTPGPLPITPAVNVCLHIFIFLRGMLAVYTGLPCDSNYNAE